MHALSAHGKCRHRSTFFHYVIHAKRIRRKSKKIKHTQTHIIIWWYYCKKISMRWARKFLEKTAAAVVTAAIGVDVRGSHAPHPLAARRIYVVHRLFFALARTVEAPDMNAACWKGVWCRCPRGQTRGTGRPRIASMRLDHMLNKVIYYTEKRAIPFLISCHTRGGCVCVCARAGRAHTTLHLHSNTEQQEWWIALSVHLRSSSFTAAHCLYCHAFCSFVRATHRQKKTA